MGDSKMNKFVHRIFNSSTASSIVSNHGPATHQLIHQELQHAKLLYFGEFHSESRIISFQTELVKEWTRCLALSSSSSSSSSSSGPPRLHLIMEHFSVDMQSILDKYIGATVDGDTHQSYLKNDDEAFEELIRSYKNDFGTEGHDLLPYRELLQFCRSSTKDEESFCDVHIHGGFIPRNQAARLNKECPDIDTKKLFFDEMSSERGYLPLEREARHKALFEDDASFKLRGTPEHRLLIQSLMNGADLYSPSEVDGYSAKEEEVTEDEDESPMPRLYQAQLLKDHAMGYKISSLMLDHYEAGGRRSLSTDRFLVIAGFGHLKHYLGVPDCVKGYLRQEALFHSSEHRRAVALDLLISISQSPPTSIGSNINQHKFGGKGSAMIGCQMMYEAYLEDSYPPMMDDDNEISDDEEYAAAENVRRKQLKDLYLQNPKLLDEHIMKSKEISGPLLNFANGIAGFEHPCADYLFVYDEDDDNVIDETDLDNTNAKCPFHDQADTEKKNAKDETMEAYELVGKTASMKGNAARARAIMSQIGYTDEDMVYIGDSDIYNFQGVANPHNVAKIQSGEAVLDIGSGLGIDSFLAMRDCGADNKDLSSDEDHVLSAPFVVGVDLADSEVKHATKRASARGYSVPQRIKFIRGDVEKLEDAFSIKNVRMEAFDVCISNGAFCLVPDKLKAFTNVFKSLKSGGRMAISTTTIVSDSLDPSIEWPVCMRMFASLESIKPICEEIGFKNVQIIDAQSPMEDIELPIDDESETNDVQRFKIHGKYADQFSFLEKMDMDDICKVVTIYGEKPTSSR